MNTTPPTLCRHRGSMGFSLVEVLAAMTVLAIMVVLVARLFADSSAAWQTGMSRAENNLNGRASVEFMAREISQMLADDRISMVVQNNNRTDLYGATHSDTIAFATLNHYAEYRSSNPYRDVQQVIYYPEGMTDGRFIIKRHVVENERQSSFACYQNRNWWQGMPQTGEQAFGENTAQLKFYCFNTNGAYVANFDSRTHGPPLWIDILLQVTDTRHGYRAQVLNGGTRTEYINRNSQVFMTRVYIHNRNGYAKR